MKHSYARKHAKNGQFKRGGGYRRRKRNPSVMMANRGHRRHKMRRRRNPSAAQTAFSFTAPQRALAKGYSRAPLTDKNYHQAARRHRKGRRVKGRTYAYHGRKYRIIRRNPSSTWIAAVRAGVCGGLGIVVARMVGGLYTRHVSKLVIGEANGYVASDGGFYATDGKSWRAIANEVGRLIVMGGAVIVLEQQLVRRIGKPEDGAAFLYGGLAETGRQAIGFGLARLSPTTDLGKYGLAGPGMSAGAGMPGSQGRIVYDETRVDPRGVLYGRKGQQWFIVGKASREQMAGLEDEGAFSGIESEAAFSGDDDDDSESAQEDEESY